MVAEGEICFDTLLDGREPQVLEASDLGLREGLERELRQCRPAPEAESFVEDMRRTSGVAACECLAAVGEQTLEGLQIELARLERQQVAGRPREQRVRGEH